MSLHHRSTNTTLFSSRDRKSNLLKCAIFQDIYCQSSNKINMQHWGCRVYSRERKCWLIYSHCTIICDVWNKMLYSYQWGSYTFIKWLSRFQTRASRTFYSILFKCDSWQDLILTLLLLQFSVLNDQRVKPFDLNQWTWGPRKKKKNPPRREQHKRKIL